MPNLTASEPNPTISGIAALVRAAPPRLGRTRLVLIDGPAGSGKSTLAARVGTALGAQVVHGDDIYEGWTGLATMWPVLGAQILEPLARGEDGVFAKWDWERSRRGEHVVVRAADAVVIEGVGVAERRARGIASVVIYVEAPRDTCLKRGLERDGEAMRGEWLAWQDSEAEFLEREGTRAAAHLVVDGTRPVDS